jgi:dephospho-CoA kinase
MLSVALTGNIGAGKSTVAELFRSRGVRVIDSDALARELQAPGQPVLAAIVDRFGREMMRDDGSLDRERLRETVLANPPALQELNRIVHPAVHQRRRRLLQEAQRRGERLVISDIPLLFEAADPAEFDAVILVDAPESTRRARLLASRSLTGDQIDRLMATQLSSALKRPASDYIIENDGDLASLERATNAVWQALMERA